MIEINKTLKEYVGFEIPELFTMDDLAMAGESLAKSLKSASLEALQFFSPRVVRQEPTPALTYGSPEHSPGTYGSSFTLIAYVAGDGADLTKNLEFSSIEISQVHTAMRVTSVFLILIGAAALSIAMATPPAAAPLFALISAEKVIQVGLACYALAVVLFGLSKLLIENEVFSKFYQPVKTFGILTPYHKSVTVEYRNKLFSNYTRERLERPFTRASKEVSLYEEKHIEVSQTHQILRITGVALLGLSSIGFAALLIAGSSIALPITLLQAEQSIQALTLLATLILGISVMTIKDEVVAVQRREFQIKNKENRNADLYSGLNGVDWDHSYIKKSDIPEVREYKNAYDYSAAHTEDLFKTTSVIKPPKNMTDHPLHEYGLLPEFPDPKDKKDKKQTEQ